MTARLLVMAALALIGIGYLLIEFGRYVLDDRWIAREAGETADRDEQTAAWLRDLREAS